ncbi:MAG: methylenetetrahydrofolate reductase C-terminal domain-containing protein [Anaerolineae bacterium]|nr:methylenetetrahydrofolate reductase C-terminal domain-containing protein [Anaerolineae bacterium]NUQ04209.1 methylenetetrahydrofolate reductase C-terminal domain-containing protein [Anaerolineae bacterium]
MPLLTPGRRWQPAYFPFKREPLSRRLLAALERAVKGPLFGCRMCGNCLLQETAFICPMECPKGLRNGPCGGSLPERCYVDETRPCVWYHIYKRSEAMGRSDKLLEVLPPLDWDKVGTETWGDIVSQIRRVGVRRTVGGLTSRDPSRRAAAWDAIFTPVRQPNWWQGDALYHPPAYQEPISELERRLRAGEFVVTAEMTPPLGASTDKLVETLASIRGWVAAVNFTDSASAMPRMSSLACSAIAAQQGVEPVLQIAARDHTRTGIQSEIMGANALGIRNVLCLSGDHARMGAPPYGRSDIVDLDSVQILWMLRRMRDEQMYLDQRAIKTPPRLFLGAAASPGASEARFQALREQKKINAGAQFLQTNLIFDIERLEIWLDALARRNVLDKVHIIVGVALLKSLKSAQYMHEHVPGVRIPETIFKRLEAAGDAAGEEGVQITLELIAAVRRFPGIHGVHLVTIGRESLLPRIIAEAGLASQIGVATMG